MRSYNVISASETVMWPSVQDFANACSNVPAPHIGVVGQNAEAVFPRLVLRR